MEDIKSIQNTYDKLGLDESNFLPVGIRSLLKATPDAIGYEDYFFMRLFPTVDRVPMYNNYLANQWATGYVPTVHTRMLNSKTCPSISKKLVSKIVGNIAIGGEPDQDISFIQDAIVNFTDKITQAEAHCLDRGESIITADVIGDKVDGELINKRVALNVYPLARYKLQYEANGKIFDAMLFKALCKEDNTSFINYLICEHRFYKVRDGKKIPFMEYIVVQNTWNQNDGFWNEEIKSKRLDKADLPDKVKKTLGETEINKPKEIPTFGVYRLKNTSINKLAPYSDMGESQFIDASGWMMAVETAMTYREMDKYLGRGRVLVPQLSVGNGLNEDLRQPGVPYTVPKHTVDRITDHTFMTPFKSVGGSLDSKAPIEPVQFNLRGEEWNSSFSYAEAKVCVRCGLSVLDFDPTLMGGIQRTATEIDYMNDITANTVKEKRALIKAPLNELVKDVALMLGYEASVEIRFDSSTLVNKTQSSQMAVAQFGAGLMSLETALKEIHPEWGQAEIEAEKGRIAKERDNAVAVGAFNQTFGL